MLSKEQIENWRKVLCHQLGPYALIMPEEQIQAIRDRMQDRAIEFDKSLKAEENRPSLSDKDLKDLEEVKKADFDRVKNSIDDFISQLEGDMRCPPTHQKNYYMKCLHLIWVCQKTHREYPDDIEMTHNIEILKAWMSRLREAKL